ncbi:MAG: transcriptional repressor [Erysipelothrix sp.]|nr:transcriptional repressor [Erysipelothrix sp.]
MSYRTKQRDTLLDAIISYDEVPFTADQLLLDLMNSKEKVSKATLYRNLDKFEQEGLLRKYFIQPQEGAMYQYIGNHQNCEEHYHSVCYHCGRLFHVKCSIVDDLQSHFMDDHNFKIDLHRTLLYGICDGCQTVGA